MDVVIPEPLQEDPLASLLLPDLDTEAVSAGDSLVPLAAVFEAASVVAIEEAIMEEEEESAIRVVEASAEEVGMGVVQPLLMLLPDLPG